MRGKFLVIYGSNNSGKSAQITMLADYIRNTGREVEAIKYPIYSSITGQMINAALREGNPLNMTDEMLQWCYAENRADFEPTLEHWLASGKWVVAEDYVGTGLAWGLTQGVSRQYLDQANGGLLQPDWAILLDNRERFVGGIERNHRFESAGDEIWEQNRQIHLELAGQLGWEVIDRTGIEMESTHQLVVDKLTSSGLV